MNHPRLNLVCHICEMVALAIWIGGLVVLIGSVIPAVFNSFGMEPGGRFLTRVFDGYNRLVVMAIAILLSAGAFRFWIGTRDGIEHMAPVRLEIILLATMIVLGLFIFLLVGPAAITLQEQAFAAKEEMARKDAYTAFFRMHMVIRAIYVLNLILGIMLVTVKFNRLLNKGA